MGEAKRRVEAIASGAEKACGNCQWWMQAKGTPVGLCRRLPPIPIFVGGHQQNLAGQHIPVVVTYHPQTPADTMCGEHKPRLDLASVDFSKLEFGEPTVEDAPRADA